MTFVKLALTTGVGMATLAACGSANDGYDPSIPTSMIYVGGSGQSAEINDPVTELLTIRTTNYVGDPVGNVAVEWIVESGGGTVSQGETTTDANGISQVSWVLDQSSVPRRCRRSRPCRDPRFRSRRRRATPAAGVAATVAAPARCASSGEAHPPSLVAPCVRSCRSGLRRR
jgi:hypothetical protein